MNRLETMVLRLIGESVTTPDVFADTSAGLAQIRDSLNDAVEELCMATGAYRRRYLLTMMEDRAIYRLSPKSDYIGCILGAWDRETLYPLDQTDLISLSHSEPWLLKTSGTPKWYYPLGWQYVGFYPKPGSKGRVLELEILAIPRPYAHGYEVRHLRTEWERAAVFRAVGDHFATRGDAVRATEWFTRYLETGNLMGLKPEQAERVWQFRKEKQDKT